MLTLNTVVSVYNTSLKQWCFSWYAWKIINMLSSIFQVLLVKWLLKISLKVYIKSFAGWIVETDYCKRHKIRLLSLSFNPLLWQRVQNKTQCHVKILLIFILILGIHHILSMGVDAGERAMSNIDFCLCETFILARARNRWINAIIILMLLDNCVMKKNKESKISE